MNKKDYPTMEDFNKNFYERTEIKLIFMYSFSILVIPLCLLKDISKMKNASIFGLLSLFYIILLIVIQSPMYYSYYRENIYKPDDVSTHINWADFSVPFDLDTLYIFTGIATVIYSYTCHTAVFPVYKTLKTNVSQRINRVFSRSVILNTIVYLFIGISGYLTQPHTKNDLVIFRQKIPGSNDIAMSIARLLMAIMVFLFTPANFNALRLSFLSLFFGDTSIINRNNFLYI
jgi:amino acid permease